MQSMHFPFLYYATLSVRLSQVTASQYPVPPVAAPLPVPPVPPPAPPAPSCGMQPQAIEPVDEPLTTADMPWARDEIRDDEQYDDAAQIESHYGRTEPDDSQHHAYWRENKRPRGGIHCRAAKVLDEQVGTRWSEMETYLKEKYQCNELPWWEAEKNDLKEFTIALLDHHAQKNWKELQWMVWSLDGWNYARWNRLVGTNISHGDVPPRHRR